MSSSIFNIPSWIASNNYNKWDIVINGGLYYYCLSSNLSSANFTTDLNNALWAGYISDNNESKPYFIFTPSYNLEMIFDPKVKTTQFGDGYMQILTVDINNNLIKLNLTFEERSSAEATAILHFLFARQGSESFIYSVPPPISSNKRFRCKTFNHKINFYENHTVTATFEESVR